MTRLTYVIELEGKPENAWYLHRELLKIIEQAKAKAESETVSIRTAWNADKSTGFNLMGLLGKGIGKGAKNLWNWWNEPEPAVQEP